MLPELFPKVTYGHDLGHLHLAREYQFTVAKRVNNYVKSLRHKLGGYPSHAMPSRKG